MPFASIFVPDFMLQAVVRSQPQLRNRALILVDADSPLRPVIQLNEAASKAGIKPGMAKSQAQQFGEMEIRDRSVAQERITHAALLDLGWSLSPRIEDAGPDNILLDLAGLGSIFGPEEEIARRLEDGANRLGLRTQIAIAANLDAAIFASRAFTGITLIPKGEEAGIIGKAPVSALFPARAAASLPRPDAEPASSPRDKKDSASLLRHITELSETLERWGVHTCAQLAALPVLQLSERLGQEGVRLHELAQGGAARAMVLARPGTFFEEEMELEHAVAELEPLAFLVGQLLERLCARLAARSLAAGEIRLRLELEPSFEEALKLSEDSPRQTAATNRFERTLHLPLPRNDPKTLLKLLILSLQSAPPSAPILKIFLAAQAAHPRVLQGGLFSPICPDPEKLELTVARLANLVGDENIGSPELVDTHRPDGFRMQRFAPNDDQSQRSPQESTALAFGAREKGLKTALRIFRPALAARVSVREGRPAQVISLGVRGRVVAASGPWRSSGEWWREDGWEVDEWELEIQYDDKRAKAGVRTGVYRLTYDGRSKNWFVRGAYD